MPTPLHDATADLFSPVRAFLSRISDSTTVRVWACKQGGSGSSPLSGLSENGFVERFLESSRYAVGRSQTKGQTEVQPGYLHNLAGRGGISGTPCAKQTKHPATSARGPTGRQSDGRQLSSSRWSRISSAGVLGHIVGSSMGRAGSGPHHTPLRSRAVTVASEVLGRRTGLSRALTHDVRCDRDLRVPMDDRAVRLADRYVARATRATAADGPRALSVRRRTDRRSDVRAAARRVRTAGGDWKSGATDQRLAQVPLRLITLCVSVVSPI
jgi:hypothetical protein